MQIGFIGAGKAGRALGRYFHYKGLEICGYYDTNAPSAQAAAYDTESVCFTSVRALVSCSDTLFLSVPDGAIKNVWEQIKCFDIHGKTVCHLSGAYTATEIFGNASECGAYCFSVHPLAAMTDNMPTADMENAHFCIEGDEKHIDDITAALELCGNAVHKIPSDKKPVYHAAAVFVSNFAAALMAEGTELLMQCGFDREAALSALSPIALANIGNICRHGCSDALTGPVERCDTGTVVKHMSALEGNDRELYRLLSLKLTEIAEKKHPEYDYSEMTKIMKGVE